jgi:non-lysosomal glucosylceramidase
MSSAHDRRWPTLTRYDQEHLARIALPLGGIGTGTVSLGGRGNLHDWEIVNRPAKGFTPPNSFFALYAQPAGGAAVTRALEGALPPHYEGSSGSTAANHGLPRFRH